MWKAGAVGAAAVAFGMVRLRWPAPAGAQEGRAAAAEEICVLTPELTEGPYYVDETLIRYDITEGKAGVPLTLRIAVNDATSCAPLANAAVDIWHCDALGYYSGVDANNPGGEVDEAAVAEAAAGTFLRGVQLTDADGVVELRTIYPGWYAGRTVHIHMMVQTDGAAEGERGEETYEGGQVNHTGQLFFDDALTEEIFASVEPYAGRDDAERLRNDDDTIFGEHGDEPGFQLSLTPVTEGSPGDGFVGTITIGVDPEATPNPVGGDGRPSNQGGDGGPPPGGPPPGEPDGTPPADAP